MPTLFLTRHLSNVAGCEARSLAGESVGEVLEEAFASTPRLRHYILDEQGRLRKHIAIFLDGRQLAPPEALGAPISAESEIYVMQALSGG